jgi:hypothetical protein
MALRVLLPLAQPLVAQGRLVEAGVAISRAHAAYSKERIPLLRRIMEDIDKVLGSKRTGGQLIDLPDVADGVANTIVGVSDFSGLREFLEGAIASGEVEERVREPLPPIYARDNQVAMLLATKPFQEGTVKRYGGAGAYVTSVRELLLARDGEDEVDRVWLCKLYTGSYLAGLLAREEERDGDAVKVAAGEKRGTDTLARIFAEVKVEVEQCVRDPSDFEVRTAYVEFSAGALPGGGLFYARVAEARLAMDNWTFVVNENPNFVTLRGATMLDSAKAAEMGA